MISHRQRQMLKRCRRKGGDCPCRDTEQCAAERELQATLRHLQSGAAQVTRKLKWLNRKPCQVRPDWVCPEKPDGDYFLAVYGDDGWHPHWYSDTEEPDCIEIDGETGWPFVEDSACAEDWERLGFTVM